MTTDLKSIDSSKGYKRANHLLYPLARHGRGEYGHSRALADGNRHSPIDREPSVVRPRARQRELKSGSELLPNCIRV